MFRLLDDLCFFAQQTYDFGCRFRGFAFDDPAGRSLGRWYYLQHLKLGTRRADLGRIQPHVSDAPLREGFATRLADATE
jgi:hypothetical protein